MVQTHDDMGVPMSPAAALADLDRALTRDVPPLEAGLDVAFGELRAARMAIAAPWSPDTAVTPLDLADIVRTTSDLVAGTQHNALPSTIAELTVRTNSVSESEASPHRILQEVQRKTSAPISGMMSAMQIRDELEQRVSHLRTAIRDAETADAASLEIFATVLRAQVHGLTEDLEKVLYNMVSAAGATIDVIDTCTGLADETDRFADTRESTRDLAKAAFADAVSGEKDLSPDCWRGVITDLRRCGADPALPDALSSRLACGQAAMDLIIATMPRMRSAVDGLRNIATRLPSSIETLDLDHPLLGQLWQTYTVDAERAVQTRLVQRRQAA